MIKNVSVKWLKKHDACNKAVERFKNQKVTEPTRLLRLMIRSKNRDILEWANWLIVRVMNQKQRVQYAVFAAELVLQNFESEFPHDNRPKMAIEAAKRYLKNQTQKNKTAARSAAESAARSADSADSAESADSADSAAWSADSAAWSAGSAWNATWSAARSAAESADSAAWSTGSHNKTLIQILRYGVELLK